MIGALTATDRQRLIAAGLIKLPETAGVQLEPREAMRADRADQHLCIDCGAQAKRYADKWGVRCEKCAPKNYRRYRCWKKRRDESIGS